MFTFPSRQYARRIESVGKTERLVGILVLLLLAGIVAAFVRVVVTDTEYLFDVDEALSSPDDTSIGASTGLPASASDAESPNPFPGAGVSGWRRPANVARYAPDDLHVKIDGRAEIYLQLHVGGLTFGTYAHETDADRTIDVYWYDMGEAGNATAIHRSEAAPGATQVAIGGGAEGYQIGGAVFFRLGASYVQVLPGGVDEADAAACLKIAERIAERIAGGIADRIEGGESLSE